MPQIEVDGRFQKAVLWEFHYYDDNNIPVVYSPIEINVRWDGYFEEQVAPESNNVRIDAQVIVNRDIAIGSIMWLGSLASLPVNPTNLMLVIEFTPTLDVKGRSELRVCNLMRYTDALPQTVGTGS